MPLTGHWWNRRSKENSIDTDLRSVRWSGVYSSVTPPAHRRRGQQRPRELLQVLARDAVQVVAQVLGQLLDRTRLHGAAEVALSLRLGAAELGRELVEQHAGVEQDREPQQDEVKRAGQELAPDAQEDDQRPREEEEVAQRAQQVRARGLRPSSVPGRGFRFGRLLAGVLFDRCRCRHAHPPADRVGLMTPAPVCLLRCAVSA
ncbi:hypothetical protein M8542_05525 [Amycolatopsis sp. OK19-0408]|uniref:Uncharacterized protein n=1 Tax=Amycolatopsis iheyensis TaxID=2945988 RepID=A0A9X2N5C9_9PSEU|nr:hypothetical protein [Amycolatopsis iheyensis]